MLGDAHKHLAQIRLGVDCCASTLTLRDYTLGFAESQPSNMSRYSDTFYDNLNRI